MLLIVEKRLGKIIFISSILFFLQGHESAMYAVFVCVCVCVRVRVRVRVCFFKPNVNACPRDQGCTLRDQVNNFLTYC